MKLPLVYICCCRSRRKCFESHGLRFSKFRCDIFRRRAVLVVAQAKTRISRCPSVAKQLKNPFAGQQAPHGGVISSSLRSLSRENGEGSGNIPASRRKDQGGGSGEISGFITRASEQWHAGLEEFPVNSAGSRQLLCKTLGQPQRGRLSKQAEAPMAPTRRTCRAAAAVYRLPPRETGRDTQDHAEGSSHSLRDGVGGHGPQVVARPDRRLAQGSGKAQSGRVHRWARQSADHFAPPRMVTFSCPRPGRDIRVFRGINSKGRPEQMAVFASGLNEPFGIAFYPPGPASGVGVRGKYGFRVSVPISDAICRRAVRSSTLPTCPAAEAIRPAMFGSRFDRPRKCLVSVARFDVNDPDPRPQKRMRADVAGVRSDGSAMLVYAYGIRNCVGSRSIPRPASYGAR